MSKTVPDALVGQPAVGGRLRTVLRSCSGRAGAADVLAGQPTRPLLVQEIALIPILTALVGK